MRFLHFFAENYSAKMRFKRDFLAISANYRNFFTFTTVIGVLLEILRGGGGINARGLKISLAYCESLYCEPVGLLMWAY